VRKWPEGVYKDLDKAGLDWEKEVFTDDALILEVNMGIIEKVGHGFIEEAIRQLGGTPMEPGS
jgi:hypothetical protein